MSKQGRVVSHPFKVGDLVNYKEGCRNYLRSGWEVYGCAVVVSETPFVCVSEEGDMRWETTLEPHNMEKVGTASAEVLKVAMRRL